MVAAVESMAYAGETPWHGLGNSVSNNLTPKQMCKKAGCDWGIELQDMYLKSGHRVPDAKALVRDKDNRILSVVGSGYKPLQNEEAFDFFKKFVQAGHMTMETAGSLQDGKYIWVLAKINADFKLGKGDEIKNYLLMCSPHVHGKAMTMLYTAVRVVCWNTLTAALRGNGALFRMPHSQSFDYYTRNAAEQALGLVTNQAKEFKEASTLLSKKSINEKKLNEYFFQVLEFDPAKADQLKGGGVREPRMLPMFKHAYVNAPGQDLGAAHGTLWGAFNAVSYVTDHEVGRTRDTALRSAWLGQNAQLKRKAFNIALDMAK